MFCKICGRLLNGTGNIRYCCGTYQTVGEIGFTTNYASCPKCGSNDLQESVTKEYQEEIIQTFTTRVCTLMKCRKCGHVW